MSTPQSNFVKYCQVLAGTIEDSGLEDMTFIREVAVKINENARRLCAEENLIEFSSVEGASGAKKFISVVDPKLGYKFCYSSDTAVEMTGLMADSLVKLLYRWAEKVESEPTISLPYRKDRSLLNAVWEDAEDAVEVFQKIVEAMQIAGQIPATDSLNDEAVMQIFNMIVDKKKLAKRVGYSGGFDWGLLGATEEFMAKLVDGKRQTDTKTDKPGKNKKRKREPTAEAVACGKWIKIQKKMDPTLSRKQLVDDWYEMNAAEWKRNNGKITAASTINKVLQENPQLWKPEE